MSDEGPNLPEFRVVFEAEVSVFARGGDPDFNAKAMAALRALPDHAIRQSVIKCPTRWWVQSGVLPVSERALDSGGTGEGT